MSWERGGSSKLGGGRVEGGGRSELGGERELLKRPSMYIYPFSGDQFQIATPLHLDVCVVHSPLNFKLSFQLLIYQIFIMNCSNVYYHFTH